MKKNELSGIAVPLLAWFQQNKRMLPWREDKEPYHVWISEIMLQQTRIEAVMGYYARFLEALPTVTALADCPDEQLLKLWEGLGYYSRARNLKKAAQMIMNEHGGIFPATFRELKQLPGIGDYTAGAIASICFNEPVAAVDGNVLRVLARLTGSRKNVLLPEAKKDAEVLLQTVLPPQSGDFNEGLMELGEVVCLPNAVPLCDRCPLRAHCVAYKEGLTEVLPVRIKKQTRKKEEKTVYVLVTPQGDIALEKRQEKGLLSGLYQLPNTAGFQTDSEVRKTVADWQLTPTEIANRADVKHVFTHIEWQMRCFLVRVSDSNAPFIWASPADLTSRYPLPTAFAKVLRRLTEQ